MTTLITLTDLIDRFGEAEILKMSDKDKTKTINHEVINNAIKASMSDVMGYLRSAGLVKTQNGQTVYAYPQMPDDLTQKLCDVARWYLYDKAITTTVQARYEQAMAWFKDVKKDPTMLTGIDEDENNEQTGYQSSAICVIPNTVPSIYD